MDAAFSLHCATAKKSNSEPPVVTPFFAPLNWALSIWDHTLKTWHILRICFHRNKTVAVLNKRSWGHCQQTCFFWYLIYFFQFPLETWESHSLQMLSMWPSQRMGCITWCGSMSHHRTTLPYVDLACTNGKHTSDTGLASWSTWVPQADITFDWKDFFHSSLVETRKYSDIWGHQCIAHCKRFQKILILKQR